MPPRRRKRRFRRTRKKRFARKRRRTRKKSMPKQLIPTRTSRTMRFSKTFTLDPAEGTLPVFQIFRANSILDPDFTAGSATNVMGFELFMGNGNQYSAQYDHFTVVGCKLRCVFSSTSDAILTGQASVGITPRDGVSTIAATRNTLIQNSRTKSATMSHASGNRGQIVMTYAFNPNRFLSLKNPLSNSLCRGSFSTQPPEQAYLNVWAAQLGSSAGIDPAPIICTLEIEYATVFTEPVWQELDQTP